MGTPIASRPACVQATARRIRSWLEEGVDVYAYFNNDWRRHAPRNANDLRQFIDQEA